MPRPIKMGEWLLIHEYERLENKYREENRFQTFYSQESTPRPITIGEGFRILENERLEN